MDATEVIISEVQRKRSLQVFPLLTKSIREPRKSSHRHSDIKVLTLNMRSTDFLRVRITKDRHWHSLDNFGRRIAMLVRLRRTVDFNKLCIVSACTKRVSDCIRVSREAVCRDLNAVLCTVHSLKDFLCEKNGVALCAAA